MLKSLQCRAITCDGLRMSFQVPLNSPGTGPPTGQFAAWAVGRGQGMLSGVEATAAGVTGWAVGVVADAMGALEPHAVRITTAIRPYQGLVNAVIARRASYRSPGS